MIDDERYGSLRQHQADGKALARDIINGKHKKKVFLAAVTPGGGKSIMASVVAHELLDADMGDAVCVVCPQDTLRHQMKSAFHSPDGGRPRQVVPEGNGSLASKQGKLFEYSGYVTTYQAIARAPKSHVKRFASTRHILFLDEVHHLAEEEHAAWYQAIKPLVDLSEIVVLMSGTLDRHDRSKIPFVVYDENKEAVIDIKYTRRDALEEHAVIPIAFRLTDGAASYDYRHRSYSLSLKDAPKKQEARALKTALLDPAYRHQFIIESLREWEAYRRDVYPSRAIVILHTQDAAKLAFRQIRKVFGESFHVVLATSSEKKDGKRALARFRDYKEGHILVTVNMAYEGLDVPDVTHLVCLTDKRSRPWLEQAITRATRFDRECGRPWEGQQAFVYAPNDVPMQRFVDTIMDEQEATFLEHAEGGVAPARGKSTFHPHGAIMGDHEYGDLDGRLTAEENEIVAEAREDFPDLFRHAAPRRILAAYAPRSARVRQATMANGIVRRRAEDDGVAP